MTTKRLYRVTATYPDGRVWRRTYQDAKSATERGASLRLHAETTGAVVTIEASDPVTFPSDGAT